MASTRGSAASARSAARVAASEPPGARGAAHVARFNAAVQSGDWDEFVTSFADDAVLEFLNVPAGPYRGRPEIAAAYRDNPPDDTIAVQSVATTGQRDALEFGWTRGGAGLLTLEWTDEGTIDRMVIEFR
jgi:steroid delta-isomerase